MKANLAPTYTQKIGNNILLWFQSSNSYIIVSESTNNLLKSYLNSKDSEFFKIDLKDKLDFNEKDAEVIYLELTEFLNNVNFSVDNSNKQFIPKSIPFPQISKFYQFGSSIICINYSDEKLVALIHPNIQHASISHNENIDATFDVFCDDNYLYLFKNKKFVGNYKRKAFHFLQGKFAMELVCSIYKNTEADWLATFHASTICNDQEAIMIIGDSGNGKSTLSALLMAHGFDLLSDDFTPMLADNQHLYRFPAAISIKKGAFSMIEKLYQSFQDINLERSSSKSVSIKYLPPKNPFLTSKKHFECKKIVMVKFDPNTSSTLKECASEKMLQTLIPDSWISPDASHSKLFFNWLKNVKFYELTYSNNDFAVDKFKELFKLQ